MSQRKRAGDERPRGSKRAKPFERQAHTADEWQALDHHAFWERIKIESLRVLAGPMPPRDLPGLDAESRTRKQAAHRRRAAALAGTDPHDPNAITP